MFTVRNNFTKFGKILQNVPHGEHFSNCSTKFSMFTENVLQIWAKFVEHLLFLPGMKREKSHLSSKTMIFREHFCFFCQIFRQIASFCQIFRRISSNWMIFEVFYRLFDNNSHFKKSVTCFFRKSNKKNRRKLRENSI